MRLLKDIAGTIYLSGLLLCGAVAMFFGGTWVLIKDLFKREGHDVLLFVLGVVALLFMGWLLHPFFVLGK